MEIQNKWKIMNNKQWLESVGKVQGLTWMICDIFEEMLDQKGIVIPDEDRTGDECEACLYGMTYAFVHDEIYNLLTEYLDE